VLKLFVDVGFWVVLVGAVLMSLAIVPLVLLRPANVNVGVPARLTVDPSAYSFSSPDGEQDRNITLDDLRGQVTVRGVGPWEAVEGFAGGILVLAGALIVLYQLRGIFRSLKTGRPFVRANVTRMRVLGLTLIVAELVSAGLIYWSSTRLNDAFVSEQVRFVAGFDPRYSFIFAGLLLVVLAEVFREAASMKRDLETAREIQFGLVPAEAFREEGVTVRSEMRPANTVGGDYHDVIPLGDGKVGIVQADVAGKGMPAALLMATLHGSLRTLVSAGLRGTDLVEALNAYLNENTPSNRMVTLFYGELELSSGAVTFVNAGHNPPYVMRHDGRLERVGDTAMVLGMIPGRSYPASELCLARGESLLLFTDGISEAIDRRGEEYGEQRIADYLSRAWSGAEGDALVDGLVRDVLEFCRPVAPFDDMTVTLVTRD
jgi:hypothetical protein